MLDVPDGWPCALLGATPPSVLDREAAPTPDDLLPQILALAPRGPAWGTDEAGDGSGASPVQRGLWRGIAAWVADHLTRDFTAATQAFPSAITYTLPDWEGEFGLPDPCGSPSDVPGRVLAVRGRFGALGGASPAYFVCLAASLGYVITIEEPTQFQVDDAELGPDPFAETWFCIDDGELAEDSIVAGVLQPMGDGTPLEAVAMTPPDAATFAALEEVADGVMWQYWIVHVGSPGETWFCIDDGELAPDSLIGGVLQPMGDGTPLEGFVPAADLECVLHRVAPPHTRLLFSYSLG